MIPTRLSLALVFLLIFNISHAEVKVKNKFTITTFNIQFYGIGGKVTGTSKDETRDPYLQAFLKDSVPASDIIVFEEIVDVPRLQNILPRNWQCLSYEAPLEKHQHVVLCHSPRFNFVREASDDNDIIDEVAGEEGTLRPALTTIVTDINGKKLFRIVGVHLKANPEYSKLRVSQTEIIAKYLGSLKKSKLPVIIVGDFNSYNQPDNRETQNDVELFLNTFNGSSLELKRIPNDLFTFRNSYGQQQFDQFYISDSLRATGPLHIFEVCNARNVVAENLIDIALYNKHISDHCPVSAEIEY